MINKLKIGIVGCGAIGTSLAKAIVSNFANQAELTALYDIKENRASYLAKKLKARTVVCCSLEHLIEKTNLVIEAADAGSCLSIAKRVLRKGRDIIIMSVGGIIDHVKQLETLAERKNAHIYIPSGAICGVDSLKAVSHNKVKKIILTTRKNPRSFKDTEYIRKRGIRLDKIKRDTVLFSGNARQAIRLFPQNINVAATLSIAGIGRSKTRVKIVASPMVKRNIHEVYIESDAGKISSRVENLLHPHNPRTSFLAVLSAIAVLRQILRPLKVGT